MSLNFYVRSTYNSNNEIHIGKKSGNDFMWAMKERDFKKLPCKSNSFCGSCGMYFENKEKIIVDEHHKLYTLEEFKIFVKELRELFVYVGCDFL